MIETLQIIKGQVLSSNIEYFSTNPMKRPNIVKSIHSPALTHI